jgi:hypothetical protein
LRQEVVKPRKVVREMVKEEAKEFVFEDWLAEGIRACKEGFRKGRGKEFLPEESRTHLRTARKEMLLAMRSLVDAAIERTEEKPKKKTTKIKVE